MKSQESTTSPLDLVSAPLALVEEPSVASETVKWDILVVDDSPLNRKMLLRTLRASGHAVEEAGDGREGIEMVQQRKDNRVKPYDVILMDFVMPGMDGPTATKVGPSLFSCTLHDTLSTHPSDAPY